MAASVFFHAVMQLSKFCVRYADEGGIEAECSGKRDVCALRLLGSVRLMDQYLLYPVSPASIVGMVGDDNDTLPSGRQNEMVCSKSLVVSRSAWPKIERSVGLYPRGYQAES